MTDSSTFPPGPTIAYITTPEARTDGTHRIQLVDREAPEDPRERAICRALLLHALALLDASEPARRDAVRGEQP